jgi:hypothetical protein
MAPVCLQMAGNDDWIRSSTLPRHTGGTRYLQTRWRSRSMTETPAMRSKEMDLPATVFLSAEPIDRGHEF